MTDNSATAARGRAFAWVRRSRGRHRATRPVVRTWASAGMALALAIGTPTVLLVAKRHPARPSAGPAVAMADGAARPVRAALVRTIALPPPASPAPRRARPPVASRSRALPVYRGMATWYGPGFDGRRTASGERFDTDGAMTAAHRWLPFGTRVQVCTRVARCVVVRINDRGPYGRGRIVDLSRLAARRLGMHRAGVMHVTLTVLPQ